ncbi:Hypothetical predicted protein [Cloeon dipterum]|uniref:Uncharacterized protein n=1 Tax=Cloeon dipterum TaxID=197152 RepID=A0A8S1E815_9INSE|nr:Hypothetical predicted protein [Cloeon dipterum]
MSSSSSCKSRGWTCTFPFPIPKLDLKEPLDAEETLIFIRSDPPVETVRNLCKALDVVANRRSFQKLRQKSVMMTSSGHSLPSGPPPQGEAVCASTQSRVVVRRIPTPLRSKRRGRLACLQPVPRETPGDQKLLSASVSSPMVSLLARKTCSSEPPGGMGQDKLFLRG